MRTGKGRGSECARLRRGTRSGVVSSAVSCAAVGVGSAAVWLVYLGGVVDNIFLAVVIVEVRGPKRGGGGNWESTRAAGCS